MMEQSPHVQSNANGGPSGTAGMPASRRPRLMRHLAIVLVVKVILLALLWHAFIKPNKVAVDVEAMGSRIAGTASQPRFQNTPGENK